jgi:hypothetical protein
MPKQTRSSFERLMSGSLSGETKLKVEALSTMLQEPIAVVLERAVLAYVASLPSADRDLIQSLTTRARQSLSTRSNGSDNEQTRTSRTVTDKEFVYKGSIDEGLEVLFDNSQSLRVTRESIERIREEILRRQGPALMGAIYSPLMPNSLGEAIQKKYRLSPINLSYVVPLLRERDEVQVFKKGRNWYVEPVSATGKS